MDSDRDKTIGLDEVKTAVPDDGVHEWDRDSLLIKLEIQLGQYRKGAMASWVKYLLPLAIVFPVSGGLIYYSLMQIDGAKPMWLVFTGLGFMVSGIFLAILTIVLAVLDTIKARLIAKADCEFLEEFECRHFIVKNENGVVIPNCRYFSRDLDDAPLCLICPVYEKSTEKC